MRRAILAFAAVLSLPVVGAQESTLPVVLEKAAQYVASIEASLAAVVVVEEHTQTAELNKRLGGSSLGVGGGVDNAMVESHTFKSKRTSRSELLLVRRPEAPLVWSGVRNVLDLNGKPGDGVAGRLDGLAADPVALGREWNALRETSRRVAVGPPPRDVHSPWTTLALLRSDQQQRVRFKKDGEEKIGGTVTWKVGFVEEKTPSLLRTSGNVEVPARGTMWIDPTDGRVLRTKLELGTGLSMEQMRVEVEYAHDPALGLLVPASMRERYDTPSGKVDAKTTFKGFRRVAAPTGRK